MAVSTEDSQTKSLKLNSSAEVHFSPNKQNEVIVEEYIRGAKRTLEIAAYSLTNKVISEAIKDSRKRGVSTSVVCDKQQAQIKTALCKEVQGKIDKKSGLMHNKFIVRDESCVLTGSFNFTNNAIFNNRENFIIICNKDIADEYHKEFQKIWKNNT